jgi:pullulanase/glycogen debranching enzyme
MPAPPLIREIAKHPVLSKVHLIAEPWDLGMYQVGCRADGLGFRVWGLHLVTAAEGLMVFVTGWDT